MTTATSPRKNPWPVRIAVGCGGLFLAVSLLIVGVALWAFMPRTTEVGRCQSQIMGHTCTNLNPAWISQKMKMELPAGTRVESSESAHWLDSNLKATVFIPADQVAQWEGSLTQWPAATTCTPPKQGQCARWDTELPRETRTYTRSEVPGGIRIILWWNNY